jgi:DNA-3-methyladenine glycosylase II
LFDNLHSINYILHFQSVDPILYSTAKRVGDLPAITPRHPRTYFTALCSDIIGQQLSGKVADVFWSRFTKLFPSRRATPDRVIATSSDVLRSIGISNSKVAFLKDLAHHVSSRQLNLAQLASLADPAVLQKLMVVKGIGPWTAEMFLIFTLGRSDVFSPGDQGLKNAIKKLYSVVPDPSIWSPYRSYACRILWKSLDHLNTPIT